MRKTDKDFREEFGRMAAQAVINREELATLLATTAGAVTQMTFRGELPETAFPTKRRACWFVGDIRAWLDGLAAARSNPSPPISPAADSNPARQRTGRPRISTTAGQ